MHSLAKLSLAAFSLAFAFALAAACLAAYRSECACSKVGGAALREGMGSGGAGPLSSAEYYTLSSLITQIEKDDPEFAYAFDVSAVLQVGGAHAAYAAVLNAADASVGDKISGVKALLAEEPVKKYMDLAFTTPPPDTI